MAAPALMSSLPHRLTAFARTSRQLQFLRRHLRNGNCTSSHLLHSKKWPTRTQSGNLRGQSAFKRRQRHSASSVDAGSDRDKPESVQEALPSPAYKPPTSGLLARLPSSWVPYAELIRLDKPTGTYYLFLPCLFSTLLAAPLTTPITSPLTVLATSTLFFTGALVMRGAGCTVNDLWDRNLDPHVARTRLRPIARGAISVRQAIPYLGVQLLVGLGILLQFPSQCLFYGIPSLLLVATYPLAKRLTNYPQIVLGLTFSWGATMGFPALGIDLLSNIPILISAACLYGSCVAWTVVYDMIYAYQDIRDDAKAGIKSIALAQEANAKAFLTAVAGVQVMLLTSAGLAIGAGPIFYAGTCGGAAANLAYMIRRVDLKSVQDCWAWFKKGAFFTGGAISLGLFGEYVAQYLGWYGEVGRKSLTESKITS